MCTKFCNKRTTFDKITLNTPKQWWTEAWLLTGLCPSWWYKVNWNKVFGFIIWLRFRGRQMPGAWTRKRRAFDLCGNVTGITARWKYILKHYIRSKTFAADLFAFLPLRIVCSMFECDKKVVVLLRFNQLVKFYKVITYTNQRISRSLRRIIFLLEGAT